MNNIKMLYFDRIDISEGIDVSKTSASKDCDVCHYSYFLNKGFKFQPYVCNRCHDFLMMSMNLNDIPNLKLKMMLIVVLLLELAKLSYKLIAKY